MPHASHGGVGLNYVQAGAGDPPLFFIHGWCCDLSFFEPQLRHFASSHSVTALDLRGCGESDRPPGGYDIPTFADDVAFLCGKLGITNPVVVGHSLGGSIAVELSGRYPYLPAAVVALDPGPLHPTPEATAVYAGFAAQMTGPDGEAVRRAWVSRGQADDQLGRKVVDTMCSVPLDIAAETMRGTTLWNSVAALLTCRAPLLVVRAQPGGSNDPMRLRALKPDIHIGITVGAGHFHQLEVPDQINAMIERFLQVALTDGQNRSAA